MSCKCRVLINGCYACSVVSQKMGKIVCVDDYYCNNKCKIVPSYAQMANNLLTTGADVIRKAVKDGRVLCPDEQRVLRKAICDQCDHQEQIKGHERCVSFPGEAGCGCYLEQKRKLAAARCDLGKWDDVDKGYTVKK